MTDKAFEAEARRQGRVMRRRHAAFAMPLLAGILVFIIVLVNMPLQLRMWFALIYLVALVAATTAWGRFLRHRYTRFPEVHCPTCGGVAHVEMADLPQAHFYLVCPKCGQRADTGFASKLSPYAPST